jgi:hypothetical protein
VVQHATHVGDAAAEPHVGTGIVRDRSATVAQPLHVVVVEPHAVRHREALVDQAHLVHVGGERRAVDLVTRHCLDLRLGDMALDADVVFLCEVAAGDQEIVAAMERDGRRQGELHHLEWPLLQRPAHLLRSDLPGRLLEALDLRAQPVWQALHQAGDRLEERDVGHQRCQHAAHADVLIGFRHRRQALDRRQGEFGGKVVSRGAALHHHLCRADLGAEILVLEAVVDVGPLGGGQQQFERPAIVQAFGKIAWAVGVRIDQAGMHKAMLGIDHRCASGGGEAGPADLGDGVALDQDVDRHRFALGDVQELAAADDGVGTFGFAGHDGTLSTRCHDGEKNLSRAHVPLPR